MTQGWRNWLVDFMFAGVAYQCVAASAGPKWAAWLAWFGVYLLGRIDSAIREGRS
jgi:hypothetical protein